MAPEYSSQIEINERNNESLELEDLPFAASEVKALQFEFGGKALLGNAALRSSFIDLAPKYDILHLAMHTLINDSLPMFSKLVFSPNENGKKFFHTSDIYGLNLKASMVTLSACNTGSGMLKKGEGIMSLARGFVFAGVPSVVMTLWEVQDETGLKIMKAFYGFLSEGLPKDEAMQQAKLQVLSSLNMIKAHPNFWSAYIVTGDTAAINIGDDKQSVWLMLLFIIPFLIVFFFYRRIVSSVKY